MHVRVLRVCSIYVYVCLQVCLWEDAEIFSAVTSVHPVSSSVTLHLMFSDRLSHWIWNACANWGRLPGEWGPII